MKTFLRKNLKWNRSSLGAVLAAFGIAATLAACGSKAPITAPVGTTNGQMSWYNNQSCFANPFSPGCPGSGGPLSSCQMVSMVKDSAGRDLQKYICYPLAGYSGIGQNPAPWLSPDSPQGQYYGGYGQVRNALMTSSYVRPGDKVVFSASGGYTATNSNFVFTDCKKTSLNATPHGLYASDGTKAYPMHSGSQIVIENEGALRIGFNYDASVSYSCTALSNMQFVVHHCQEASGTTYPCP
ncbi:MAG: hypothetical protein JNL01_16630 [Bdellovibrionales bacterium]|nr:hypothetical protein [Bdellovibrionales bacterium]